MSQQNYDGNAPEPQATPSTEAEWARPSESQDVREAPVGPDQPFEPEAYAAPERPIEPEAPVTPEAQAAPQPTPASSPDFSYDPPAPQASPAPAPQAPPAPPAPPAQAQPVHPQSQPTPGYGYAAPQQPPSAPYGQDPYGQTGYGQDYNQGYAAPQYGMQPQGYGPPANYGYGGAMHEHPQAQMTLIMGIVGFFFTPTAFVAWYLGGKAKKEIQAGAPYQWDGSLKIGYLIGKIISIIAIVSLVLFVLLAILGGALMVAGS